MVARKTLSPTEPLLKPTATDEASCSALDLTVTAPTVGVGTPATDTVPPTVALVTVANVCRDIVVLMMVAPPPVLAVGATMPTPNVPE